MIQPDQRYPSPPDDPGREAGGPSWGDPGQPEDDPGGLGPLVRTRARIAVYDDLLSAPRVIDIDPAPVLRFIEAIASETYERAQQLGGRLPYTAIREIAENFIHADFKECTVSILDRGDTIRFSDRGPGIERKLLVLQPGVTSADERMRRYIRGVGSGFPIVREYLAVNHGSLRIDDNAVDGVVVTLPLLPAAGVAPATPPEALAAIPDQATWPRPEAEEQSGPVDRRSAEALGVIAELGAAGPTDLTGPLGVSTATAYRLLESLEAAGLLEKTTNRKRILSNAGLGLLRRSQGRQVPGL